MIVTATGFNLIDTLGYRIDDQVGLSLALLSLLSRICQVAKEAFLRIRNALRVDDKGTSVRISSPLVWLVLYLVRFL